jgi:DnaJ-class molecular chaperone
MWQACPICKGNGLTLRDETCTVCNGKKIISELTGLPPASQPGYNPNKTTITYGNSIPT